MSIPGEHYFKMSNAIFCYGLTPIQYTVYSYLVSCAGQKEKCWPSVRKIASNCGCSPNAARAALSALTKRGFISKESRFQYSGNRVRQTSNLYHMNDLPKLKAPVLM